MTLVAGSGTVISDNTPAAGDITIGVSGTASGAEIAYTQITATINITSTNQAAPTVVLSPGAVAFNGSPVILEVYCPAIVTPSVAPRSAELGVYESGAQLARLGVVAGIAAQIEASLYCRYRFTPSAGSHTYTIGAYANSTTGTPQFVAGVAGGFNFVPAFIRFSYA